MVVNKKKKFGVGGTGSFSQGDKLIIADSPLEDISGCRRPKGFLDFLDILAGFNFHLSFYI